MSFHGFYTTKGLTLAAKIAAGTKLTITKITAGSGETAKSAAALAQEKQTLTVGTATVKGQSAILPVTLAEANVSAAYSLTELGVYAQDPEAGEILYQVYQMDNAAPLTAGGENTFRFYLNQTIGLAGITVICSPAGLLMDEDLAPVRDKVMAVRALKTVSVTLAPEEVQPYLNALPRMLTENYSITVSAGTATVPLNLNGFYGPGYIWIFGTDGQSIFPGLNVEFCESYLRIGGLQFTGSSRKFAVTAYCHVESCTFTGDGASGAEVSLGSHISFFNSTFTNHRRGILVGSSSMVTMANCTGSELTVGLHVYRGGTIMLCESTSDTLSAASNAKEGGILVKADGTLL